MGWDRINYYNNYSNYFNNIYYSNNNPISTRMGLTKIFLFVLQLFFDGVWVCLKFEDLDWIPHKGIFNSNSEGSTRVREERLPSIRAFRHALKSATKRGYPITSHHCSSPLIGQCWQRIVNRRKRAVDSEPAAILLPDWHGSAPTATR